MQILNQFGELPPEVVARDSHQYSWQNLHLEISLPVQILNQFGELQPDVAARQRYAAWRAADINKAIKEGRAPTPPTPKPQVGCCCLRRQWHMRSMHSTPRCIPLPNSKHRLSSTLPTTQGTGIYLV